MSDDTDVLDPATGRPRLLSRRCSTCVFHPGNRIHLEPGRLADLAGSIAGHPSDRLLKTLAWLFTAHVNDRLEPGYTWIPRYAALIGPYGRRTDPALEEVERLISQSFEDFLLLMPGSNRWAESDSTSG